MSTTYYYNKLYFRVFFASMKCLVPRVANLFVNPTRQTLSQSIKMDEPLKPSLIKNLFYQ